MINEHNDPNLAETPHYKEKQTILPHPISAEVEKKTNTPIKRLHDGKIKKDKKDLCKSPMIDEQNSPKEVCIKAEEAKIDMRKLIIEHKSHKKSSSSGSSSNLNSSTKKHSSSSSSSTSHSKKEKEKHKSSSGSDSHRSHSSSKKSHSDKHRRDESRKSSSSSNHSLTSSEKHKSSETSIKKLDPPKAQTCTSQSMNVGESTTKKEEIKSNEIKEVASPIQVSSSHIVSTPPVPPVDKIPEQLAIQNPQLVCVPEPPIQPPPFDVLPPLPKEMPIEIPPPPPPLPHEEINKSNIMPDSSTQQTPHSPAPKVRKVNNGDKTAPSSDLLGSIMASMDSPRNSSNF